MSISFWFSFFFSTPPHHACTTQGVPLFEIRERSEIAKPEVTTKIFESGAWTVASDGHTDRGCFDHKELREIRRAVQRAPWQITSSPIACFAYDPNFTEYLVHGKLRFTERMCSGKTADVETLEAIDLVKKELAEEQPPHMPAPPHMPPAPLPPVHPEPLPPVKPPVMACRADGMPLFEIRKRSDMTVPTSTTAIYSTGAWTFQPIDRDGHAGALTMGCFDKRTTESLREVINQSPWDTTLLRIVCKAYSASYTQYFVHGQLEYTARLCGAQRLDDKSLGAIKIVEDDLAKVLPKQALVQ